VASDWLCFTKSCNLIIFINLFRNKAAFMVCSAWRRKPATCHWYQSMHNEFLHILHGIKGVFSPYSLSNFPCFVLFKSVVVSIYNRCQFFNIAIGLRHLMYHYS
jgi:hypothetical protein